uniref:Uncharacterized protein n=1 Tax=Helianthus annuus TaxID=4232 RepID=A0A251TLQ0_HELAN
MMNNSWRLNKLGEAWSESGSNESSIEEKRSSDARYDRKSILIKDQNRVTVANKTNDKRSPLGQALPGTFGCRKTIKLSEEPNTIKTHASAL